MKVLAIDDDRAQAELINTILSNEGHEVHSILDGGQAIRYLETTVVDILVLDWGLPGISGLEVLGWVRARIGKGLPVLFLTNHAREDQLVAALNAGADDYMVKPIRRNELVARVTALLRRAYPSTAGQLIEIGFYKIDLVNRTVTVGDELIDLTPKEFELTSILFHNAGRIMPRETLTRIIWGRDVDTVSRSLDTHIYRLKKKLKIKPENGVRLRSVYTHGYRLEPTDPTSHGDAE